MIQQKVEEVLSEIKEESHDDGLGGTIVLNSTAEFCRTLGDIPTYGLAGNREEGPSVILVCVFYYFPATDLS